MKQILFATTNKGKLGQFQFVADYYKHKVEIISVYAKYPHIKPYSEEYESTEQIVEQGSKEIFDQINEPIVVEDSITEVDALNKRPGLESADYLKQKGRKSLLTELERAQNRTARMISCVAVRTANDYTLFKNILEGTISLEERYKRGEPLWISPQDGAPWGGGYGAIFIPQKPGSKTLSELLAAEHMIYGSREPNFKKVLEYFAYNVSI